MSTPHASTEDHHKPGLYEIRLKGHLDARWADQFEHMTFTHASDGTTILKCTPWTGDVLGRSNQDLLSERLCGIATENLPSMTYPHTGSIVRVAFACSCQAASNSAGGR